MKILFLTLVNIENINERNLYADLMRKFRDEGHEVFIVIPTERRFKEKTEIKKTEGITVLKIKILNIQKINIIEKGISTLLLEYQFLSGIKKFLTDVHFDLIIYSTPPITFLKVISFIKNRDKAKSYLLLKDIFPQNAVDLGMMKKDGIFHRYFRTKEKKLYFISDIIGCMSPANVIYLLKHNPDINPNIVEVNPNSIEPVDSLFQKEEIVIIRNRYNIPLDSIVFIYGGNLGKPQGIDFLLEVLNSNKERKNVFFLIVGSGTEFSKVQSWFDLNSPANAKLVEGLPKNEYDKLIQSCDVGLIFLDKRFTIPNFPSRLLSYMEYKMPVIAATDVNTDMGKIIEKNKFGFWAESGNLSLFNKFVVKLSENPPIRTTMGENGYNYLLNNYTVSNSYFKIINTINNLKCIIV